MLETVLCQSPPFFWGGGEGEGRWGREAKNNRAVPCIGNAVPCNNLRQNLNLKGMEAFSCIFTIIKEIPMVSIIDSLPTRLEHYFVYIHNFTFRWSEITNIVYE